MLKSSVVWAAEETVTIMSQLKVSSRYWSEYFYSRSYSSIVELQEEIEDYVVYYNPKWVKLDLNGLSLALYQAQYLS